MDVVTAKPLDPNSTSPNFGLVLPSEPLPRCVYANVWFAWSENGKTYVLSQGCCNHWDCPRCGIIRARTEYARIVHGCDEISKQHDQLYFQTVTCRGRDLSRKDADAGYLAWTNRLLDSYRARVKKLGGHWAYVQVTERQKRGLPHSHFLTTFEPGDLRVGEVVKWQRVNGGLRSEKKEALRSDWLQRAVSRSGLGEQYDISRVRDQAAVSRYVAKYLFKQTAFSTEWPKGWKRVRYSQSFPRLPELKTQAICLRTWQDWDALGRLAAVVVTSDPDVFDYAGWKLRDFDTAVHLKTAH